MEEAGIIKLSVPHGTAQLSVFATKKNMLLTEIVVAAANVTGTITESKIISKMQKRRQQQGFVRVGNAHKQFTTSDLVVLCRNSSLTWPEAYNKFIFKDLDMNKNVSFVAVQYAAEREMKVKHLFALKILGLSFPSILL